jgi:COP9 signalosome complex subunit 5
MAPGIAALSNTLKLPTSPPTNSHNQEPFLAIVVDPHRTVAAGRVELGAFRTLPEGAPGAAGSADPAGEYQTIPLDKVEDFGVHANAYYPLEVSYFKSALDGKLLEALWGRYWAATLAGNPLAATAALAAGQLADVARKLEAVAEAGGGGLGSGAGGALGGALAAGGGGGGGRFAAAGARRDPSRLEQAAKDGARAAAEQAKGLATQLVKEMLFCAPAEAAGKAAAEAPMDI